MIADAGEDVEQFALARQSVTYAISGQQWQRQLASNLHGRLITRFFRAAIMPLHLDINVFPAKQFAELPHAFNSLLDASLFQRGRERSFLSAGKANQTSMHAREFF